MAQSPDDLQKILEKYRKLSEKQEKKKKGSFKDPLQIPARLASGLLDPASKIADRVGADRLAANLRAREELIEELVPTPEGGFSGFAAEVVEDVPGLVLAETGIGALGLAPKIKKGMTALQRAKTRALRGGAAGAAFSLATGEGFEDPRDIAMQALMFAAMDPAFGVAGDAAKGLLGKKAVQEVIEEAVPETPPTRLLNPPQERKLLKSGDLEVDGLKEIGDIKYDPSRPGRHVESPLANTLEQDMQELLPLAEREILEPYGYTEGVLSRKRTPPRPTEPVPGLEGLAEREAIKMEVDRVMEDIPGEFPNIRDAIHQRVSQKLGLDDFVNGDEYVKARSANARSRTLMEEAKKRGDAGFLDPDIAARMARSTYGALGGSVVGMAVSPQDRREGALRGAAIGAGVGSFATAGMRKRASDFIRREFHVGGSLPGNTHRKFTRALGAKGEVVSDAEFTIRQLEAAIKKEHDIGKWRAIPEPLLNRVNEALADKRLIPTLPESYGPIVREMRDKLDAASQVLVDEGIVQGPLIAKINANKGTYLHRSYRVFDTPDWAKQVDQTVINSAAENIRSMLPHYSEDNIRFVINDLLTVRRHNIRNPLEVLSSGKVGKMTQNVLKKKQDIPAWLRALWGEHTDPRVNYARSLIQTADIVHNWRFLNDVAEEGMGNFLYPDVNFDKSRSAKYMSTRVARLASDMVKRGGHSHPDHYVQIAPGNRMMGALADMWTTPEIAAAFNHSFDPARPTGLWQQWLRVNAFGKMGKTVLSPQAHMRNFFSNTMFGIANGHFNPWGINPSNGRDAVAATLAKLNKAGSKEAKELYKEMQRFGVVSDGAHAGEIAAYLKDAIGLVDDGVPIAPGTPWIKKAGRKIMRGFQDVYRVEDDVHKAYAYLNEVQRYKKALPDWSDEQIKRHAADIVRNTYPTMTNLVQMAERLRNNPFIGPFVSFYAESFRVAAGTLKQAKKELSSDSAAIRRIGANRAVGILAASGSMAGIGATSAMLVGASQDKIDHMRRFMAPWSKASDIVLLPEDDNGNQRIVDMSYTDSYAAIRKPAMELLFRGEDPEEKLVEAAIELFRPFLAEELLISKGVDAKRNITSAGSQVYNPEAPWDEKLYDISVHMLKAVEPGVLTSMRRILDKDKDPMVEAVAMGSGFRVQTVDVLDSMKWNTRDNSTVLTNVTRGLTDVLTREGDVSDQDIIKAYEYARFRRERVFKEMYLDTMAATSLGKGRRDVMKAMREGGMSLKNIKHAFSDRVPPIKVSVKDVISRMGATTPEEKAEVKRRMQVLKQAARRVRANEQ